MRPNGAWSWAEAVGLVPMATQRAIDVADEVEVWDGRPGVRGTGRRDILFWN